MNEQEPAGRLLVEFVLEQIAQQPAPRAVLLYRALAADCSQKSLATRCHALADEIELHQRHHRQLVLDFQRKAL